MYEPPFTITNRIVSYVASISEKIGRITLLSDMEAKPHLRKNNRIKSIHSSLKIEANSLSLNQVRDVINGKLVLGAGGAGVYLRSLRNRRTAAERVAG